MGIRPIGALGALSGVTFSVSAHACTVCDSTTARQVRAALFDGHFGHTLGLLVLPCVFLGVAVMGVYFGMPDLDTARVEEHGGDMPVPHESQTRLRAIEAEP
jgi:hypothetical protein